MQMLTNRCTKRSKKSKLNLEEFGGFFCDNMEVASHVVCVDEGVHSINLCYSVWREDTLFELFVKQLEGIKSWS